MDHRLPVAIAIATAYSIWLAWRALRDPQSSEKRLTDYAKYAFSVGFVLLTVEIALHISHMPVTAILQAKMSSTKSQGAMAFAYSCISACCVFLLASTRSKS